MGDHHPFWGGGGAGGVLEEGEGLGINVRVAPIGGMVVGEGVDGDAVGFGECRELLTPGVGGELLGGGVEEGGGLGVFDDGFKAENWTVGAGEDGRDGDGAGVEAAEKGLNKFEAGGEEEEDAFTLEALSLEIGGDGAGSEVEAGEGEEG